EHQYRCEGPRAAEHHHVPASSAPPAGRAPQTEPMKTFRQPGAVTMALTIVATCLILFLFQKILWLVVPGLLALMNYYCMRPLVERLVLRGVRHGWAVTGVVGVVLLGTVAIVFVSAPWLLSRLGQLQTTMNHYLGGGQNLLRRTIEAVEQVVPPLKR